ncbi:MAG: hypothetical protein SO009_03905 [Bacilli bacterium]|nr:hypothetical protein [Bacilli bacterium]
MKQKELKKLAEEIAELEIELQREESECRKMEIEKEILFKSENPDLKLNDYFELDILIQETIEKRLGK